MNQQDLKSIFQAVRAYAKGNSHDSETKVGCFLMHIEDGKCATLVKGANRFVSDNSSLPTTRPEKHSYIIHAEQNCVYKAAKDGISTQDLIAVVTLSPCLECARALFMAGIRTIYFEDEYHSFQHQLSSKDLNFELTKIGKYTKIELKIP